MSVASNQECRSNSLRTADSMRWSSVSRVQSGMPVEQFAPVLVQPVQPVSVASNQECRSNNSCRLGGLLSRSCQSRPIRNAGRTFILSSLHLPILPCQSRPIRNAGRTRMTMRRAVIRSRCQSRPIRNAGRTRSRIQPAQSPPSVSRVQSGMPVEQLPLC